MNDLVICPICKKTFKEINTSHLLMHNMNVEQFDLEYPGFDRLSKTSRDKKASHRNISNHTREKLKYSHTLSAFIERYGEIEGTLKYNESKAKKSNSHSLESYILKYGEIVGREKHEKHNASRGITLKKYCELYGEAEGTLKYNEWLHNQKYRTTIEYYIEKYGDKEGSNKFYEKHKKAASKRRRIPKELTSEYALYCSEVDKYTRRSLKSHNVKDIELRSRSYHLDHKISKCYGFKNNISPEIIGSIHNLRITTASENCSKQGDCIDLDEILNNFN